MDPRLLKYYESELAHLRELGGEFAREFPLIAGRLGLEDLECADPYVERLLEGFAFLAARVQLKMDSEFPQLIQNLLEIIYPQVLAPTPSMAIVQFEPDRTEGALSDGYPIPRGTALRGVLPPGGQTVCEYRTAHDLQLWPIEIVRADYFSRDVATLELPPHLRHALAGLRLRLQVAPGHAFEKLSIERLAFYLQGREELPMVLYEQFMAHAIAVLVRPIEGPAWDVTLDRDVIRPIGFDANESLLPYGNASFEGYRLLSEYFLFRQRFLFVEIAEIGAALAQCKEDKLDVIILFKHPAWGLSNAVSADNFALHCTPAINLFPKRTDPIRVERRKSEHHIVPDRTRPLDLEIYKVSRVVGSGGNGEQQEFFPFYSLTDHSSSEQRAYYAMRRTPRVISRKQRSLGTRTSYLGSEMYVSLVDRKNAPYDTNLQLLTFETLCTNRDLPLQMPIGYGPTDFSLAIAAPVNAVRCITGPTPPKPSLAHAPGEMVWKMISHLSLNYHSINEQGATTLREILRLYANSDDVSSQKQIDGVRDVRSAPIVRQLPTTGPLTFGRGLEITLTMDEEAFEGVGVYLLGAVLERFFSKYTLINSFTETVLRTEQRKEIMRWPMKIGRRQIL